MATPLQNVIDIIEALKSVDFQFADDKSKNDYAKYGVIQASISLDKDYSFTETVVDNGDGTTTKTYEVNEDMSSKEVYLAGLYSYRNMALSEHHKVTESAMNFKTINFALSGMTERAKEYMRIVWWCDREISNTLDKLVQVYGKSLEMRGD